MQKTICKITAAILLTCVFSVSPGDDSVAANEPPEGALLLPEGLSTPSTEKYQIEELRIGGRLEQVTVRHDSGLTEVYRNQRDDVIWFSEENQLGDTPNLRQWRIGSW